MHIVHTLEACWTNVDDEDLEKGGGFGGGNGQLPHCAPTYAAVNALSIIAGCDKEEYPEATRLALELLQRKRMGLIHWYITLRCERIVDDPNGSEDAIACGYRMHHDGEVDVRATYCICAVCSLLNILTEDLMHGMAAHVVECQSYEGGFGGEPFAEAHGGYTFCALGALQIMAKAKGKKLEDTGVDCDALRDWLVNRQMGYEGGFQGRCNKLVDGCYTFWVGGALAILGLDDNANDQQFDSGVFSPDAAQNDDVGVERIIDEASEMIMNDNGGLIFDQKLLQRYVLLCAQDVNGGLRDKPSKGRDFYHTCYNLSGLSASQHVLSLRAENKPVMYEDVDQNALGVTHPVYNIRLERTKFMIRSFHRNK